MSSRVIDKDRGWDRAMRAMQRDNAHVVAGIPASADAPKRERKSAPSPGLRGRSAGAIAARADRRAREESRRSRGTTLLQVATAHELGTDRIPRRSFIADTVDARRKVYAKFAAKRAADVLIGRQTNRGVLKLVGEAMVGDMKRRISAGIAPPLKPETIRRKGSSKPLIDTGQLRKSITQEVRGA